VRGGKNRPEKANFRNVQDVFRKFPGNLCPKIEQIDDKIMLDAPEKKLGPMMSHLSFTTKR
jgi:hypothetical protein